MEIGRPTLTKETYLDLLRLAGGLTLLLAPPAGLLQFNHPKLHITQLRFPSGGLLHIKHATPGNSKKFHLLLLLPLAGGLRLLLPPPLWLLDLERGILDDQIRSAKFPIVFI